MLTSFVGNLYGPVDVGHIFVITGKTVDGAGDLEVNLTSGKFEEADIPLQIAVHFHSESIERNSFVSGEWGEAEIDENIMSSPNPIVSGWDFKLLIMTSDDKFHIAINDHPYCTYNHRLPLEAIHSISIGGDLQKLFEFDHRRAFPSPWPLIHEDLGRHGELSFDIPQKFYPGHVFVISAIPSGNHNGNFILRLMQGATKRQMFHLSARFNQRSIIANSQSESLEWRKDELKCGLPFIMDQLFKLAVAITDSAFIVAIDGEIVMNYGYKFSSSFLDNLVGIKMDVINGMQLEVQGIDHFNTGSTDCEGFEIYSHPDTAI